MQSINHNQANFLLPSKHDEVEQFDILVHIYFYPRIPILILYNMKTLLKDVLKSKIVKKV